MQGKDEALEAVQRALANWLKVRQESDTVRGQYFWSGSLKPGQPIPRPEKVLTVEGIREVQAADKREQEAKEQYHLASARFFERFNQGK